MLAAVGLYGLLALQVARREREFGIRSALGATARQIIQLVAQQGAALLLLGFTAGALATYGVVRLVRNQWAEMPAPNLIACICSAIVLGIAVMIACWFPRGELHGLIRLGLFVRNDDVTLHDLKFALRQLRKSPGFTVVVVLTLGVGIGINVAMYSIIHAVLLSELPFPEADRLVAISETWADGISPMSYPDYLDWKAAQHSFDEIAVSRRDDFNMTGNGEPERFSGLFVTASYFRALKVPAKVRAHIFR